MFSSNKFEPYSVLCNCFSVYTFITHGGEKKKNWVGDFSQLHWRPHGGDWGPRGTVSTAFLSLQQLPWQSEQNGLVVSLVLFFSFSLVSSTPKILGQVFTELYSVKVNLTCFGPCHCKCGTSSFLQSHSLLYRIYLKCLTSQIVVTLLNLFVMSS
jgi:hypothetical protein